MGLFLADVRFGLRLLARNRLASGVVVLSLGLAIASNAVIFSVVDAVVLRPLPVTEPERLAILHELGPQHDDQSVSYPNFRDWQRESRTFSSLALAVPTGFTYLGGEFPLHLPALQVSGDFFRTLGISTAHGRTLLAQDDRPGAPLAAVLAYSFWQRELGGDPAAVGRSVLLDGRPFTIVGVMPEDFETPLYEKVDLWVAIEPTLAADQLTDRGTRGGGNVFGRLAPGVEIAAARREMEVIAGRLAQEHPGSNQGFGVSVERVLDRMLGPLRPALAILAAAGGLVLLIACANIGNVLLAQGVARRAELSVREALGASRRRLLAQLLAETSLMAFLGGLLGLLLGSWWIRAFLPLLPAEIPRLDEVRLDVRVLLFTAAVTAVCALLAGIVPALHGTRAQVGASLRETSGGLATGRRQRRLSDLFVVAQVGLALVLLIAASLLFGSFRRLTTKSPGLEPRGLLTARLWLAADRYAEPEQQRLFYERLLDQLQGAPGVTAAAIMFPLPLSGTRASAGFVVDGEAADPDRHESTDVFRMSPGALAAFRIPLLAGRELTPHDRSGALPVALVDETFAARLGGVRNAIGKRVKLSHSPESKKPWLEIVGVLGHVQSEGVAGESRIQLYVPMSQDPVPFAALAARGTAAPEALEPTLRQAVAELDRTQPLRDVVPMAARVAETATSARVMTVVLTVFSAVAIALAMTGVWGVIAHSVARRTPEIGLRMAIGATPGMIGSMMVWEATKRIAAGLAVGTAGAWVLTRILTSYLFEVRPREPTVFLAAACALLAAALLAASLPVLRATHVAPVIALRSAQRTTSPSTVDKDARGPGTP